MMISVSTPGSSMVAEHLVTRPSGRPRRRRPARDLDRHHVAGLGVLLLARGIWTSMISRRSNGTTKPSPLLVDVEAPDDVVATALQDAQDAALRATVA